MLTIHLTLKERSIRDESKDIIEAIEEYSNSCEYNQALRCVVIKTEEDKFVAILQELSLMFGMIMNLSFGLDDSSQIYIELDDSPWWESLEEDDW